MAKNNSFSVNVKGGTGVVVTWMEPTSIGDAEWQNRIAGDHSKEVTVKMSAAVADALHELASQSIVIKMQGAARSELKNGKVAVQAKVDGYKYGAKGGSVGVVVDAKALGLSPEQVAALKAAGATVVNG